MFNGIEQFRNTMRTGTCASPYWTSWEMAALLVRGGPGRDITKRHMEVVWESYRRNYPWLRTWKCQYWGRKNWCFATPLFAINRETFDFREYLRCNRFEFHLLAAWKRPYGALIWMYSKRFEFAPLPCPWTETNTVEHSGRALSVATTEDSTTTLH